MIDKKEIKRQYKESTPPMGLYVIKNLANSKIFIGKSTNLNGNLNRIKFQLIHGSYPVEAIQKDYNEFGAENFLFEVLDRLEPKNEKDFDYSGELELLEEMWLEKLQPYNEKGYNRQPK